MQCRGKSRISHRRRVLSGGACVLLQICSNDGTEDFEDCAEEEDEEPSTTTDAKTVSAHQFASMTLDEETQQSTAAAQSSSDFAHITARQGVSPCAPYWLDARSSANFSLRGSSYASDRYVYSYVY
jgi:hypothetical protein